MRPLVPSMGVVLFGAAALGGEAQAAWPTPEFPARAKVEIVSETLRVNGVRTRLYRFTSDRGMDDLRAFYRTAFGARVVHRRVAGAEVFGVSRDRVFTTVRFYPALRGVEGELIQSSAANDASTTSMTRLPPQSQLISRVESVDRRTTSDLLVLRNRHSVQANADFFHDTFERVGLREERRHASGPQDEALVVSFRGMNGGALVVIRQEADGFTSVTLNLITEGA